MKPFVDKLVSHFQSKGINFCPTDGKMENVVFSSKDKVVRISHHSFYRYSGIACIYRDGNEKNTIEAIDVTDEMFMNNFMKPIVELMFKNP